MSRINFPDDMFSLRPGEVPRYGDFPDLRRAVAWFRSFMFETEWIKRRERVARRFYELKIGDIEDKTGKGRYFDESDTFAWQLFLAEGFTDYPWNYEPSFGCRVVPVFAAIGRNIDLLSKMEGIDARVRRIIGPEKRQPNGGIFKLLVAAAYAREGANVAFVPEKPGFGRTHDLNATLDGKTFAVECKRMETGEYAERERARIREIMEKPCAKLVVIGRSHIVDIRFKCEVLDVSSLYVSDLVDRYVESRKCSMLWDDEVSFGAMGELDLSCVQSALERDVLMPESSEFIQLLTGSYRRNDNHISVLKIQHSGHPQYIMGLAQAVIVRWQCLSELSIEKKARDIVSKLAEANDQLPPGMPGVIHIGFEAVNGDEVEARRYEKILDSVRHFNPGAKQLEYVYVHYLAPESTPEEPWAIDETVQWNGIRPKGKPLRHGCLVLPDEIEPRVGVHWDGLTER